MINAILGQLKEKGARSSKSQLCINSSTRRKKKKKKKTLQALCTTQRDVGAALGAVDGGPRKLHSSDFGVCRHSRRTAMGGCDAAVNQKGCSRARTHPWRGALQMEF